MSCRIVLSTYLLPCNARLESDLTVKYDKAYYVTLKHQPILHELRNYPVTMLRIEANSKQLHDELMI